MTKYEENMKRGRDMAFSEMRAAQDGWISWIGGDCPVADGVMTEVKFRDSKTSTDNEPEYWRWSHMGSEHDIIAYRIVNQHPTYASPTYLMVIGNECWPFTDREAVTEAAAKCKDALVYEVGEPLRVKMRAELE